MQLLNSIGLFLATELGRFALSHMFQAVRRTMAYRRVRFA